MGLKKNYFFSGVYIVLCKERKPLIHAILTHTLAQRSTDSSKRGWDRESKLNRLAASTYAEDPEGLKPEHADKPMNKIIILISFNL
ncbi:MAG: hypothetical protein ACMUJM_25945 [bacterium]